MDAEDGGDAVASQDGEKAGEAEEQAAAQASSLHCSRHTEHHVFNRTLLPNLKYANHV